MNDVPQMKKTNEMEQCHLFLGASLEVHWPLPKHSKDVQNVVSYAFIAVAAIVNTNTNRFIHCNPF